MIKLNKKLQVSTENNDIDIFPNYLLGIVLTSRLRKILGVEYPPMFCEYWDNSNRWANNIEAANENAKKLLSRIKKDEKFSQRIISKFYSAEKNLTKISSEIEKINLNKLTNRKLAELFKTFNSRYLDVLIYGWLPIACEGFNAEFTDLLKEFLSDNLGGREYLVNNYFIFLTNPKKKNKRELARNSIINFLKKYNRSQKNKFIKKYLEKYRWLNYDYQGPALTKKNVLTEIREAKNKKDKCRGGILPRPDINFVDKNLLFSRLFKTAREFVYLKNKRQETMFYSHFCLNKLLTELAVRTGILLKEIKSMTAEEIIAAAEEGKINRDKIKEQAKHSVFVFEKNKFSIIIGENKIKDFLNKNLAKSETSRGNQIKGQASCLGKGVGRVKIINSVAEVKKMRKGDILVSSKTNPNFMAAIKKANAIVTDYGGITCHAAIVSRELGIPCIVGTKIATKVLKDGDWVEVDAEKGVVKILKRNKFGS